MRPNAGEEPHWSRQREQLVRHLEQRRIRDASVLAALRSVPRHEFVPAALRARAYDDQALALAHGQTISQPYIVALMSAAVAPRANERVLEIGTGSGYQTAILAELAKEVCTIERWPELSAGARAVLERLGVDNVEYRVGDGWQGWPARAPFDAIVVTAAPELVPPVLLDELAPGGRLCIPLGSDPTDQRLWLFTKARDGSVARTDLGGVRFVPMPKGTP